ncbi:MAG: hypothetical protein GX927_05265 [Lentisphaerae bacterium]|jgi:hypothetical protein|nr:hypothetical protein [Lentisphaerota bacterium]
MKKIAIVSCWFGPAYPNYFNLWLKSVAMNPDIDFLCFGDNHPQLPTPKNFSFTHLPLHEFEMLARAKLTTPAINITRPYKVCDFKPMYGDIFSDFLHEHDFWGHCDLDLIFGKLRDFLTEDRLNAYDKIFANGHLSLYRNTPEVNMRWRIPDAKFDVNMVLASPLNFAFDEWDGIYNIYMINGFKFFRDIEFLDPRPGTKRFRFVQRSNPKYERCPKDYPHQVFYWENGRVFRAFIDETEVIKAEEFAYMHFQKRHFPPPAETVVEGTAFFCTPQGFLPKPTAGLPSREEILEYNPYPGKIYEAWEIWWSKKKRKFRHLTRRSSFAPKSLKIKGKSWRGEN